MASRNLFGPPLNGGRGGGETQSGMARRLQHEEGARRRQQSNIQVPSAGAPAPTLQGRQDQRAAFNQQLAQERRNMAVQQHQQQQAMEQRFQQRGLGPARPVGDAPTKQAYQRHNQVIDAKSKRDQAWEAKRRAAMARRKQGQQVDQGALQQPLPRNNQQIFQPTDAAAAGGTRFMLPDGGQGLQLQVSPPAQGRPMRQQMRSGMRGPREIIEPQVAPIRVQPLGYGSSGGAGIPGASQPQQFPVQHQQDALGKHLNSERQAKVQKQKEYHEQLRQQAEEKQRRKEASRQRSRQNAQQHQGLFASGGQRVVAGGRSNANNGTLLPAMPDPQQFRPQQQQQQMRRAPINVNDARKQALQNSGPSDGGNLGLGMGKSIRQMEQLKRHELRQRAQQQEFERRQAGARAEAQARSRDVQSQRQNASATLDARQDPTDARKAALQTGANSGLQLGYGSNPNTNTSHYNTALSNLHSGAPDTRELNLQKQKAAQYRADLEAQVRAKEERKAREKAAKRAEDMRDRMAQDSAFAIQPNGGRKRLTPSGNSVTDTAAIINSARPMIYPDAVPPRPVGGADNMGRALSPTFGGAPQPGMQYQPQVGMEIASGTGISGMPLNGGPPVHQRYRAGLKDPAEMEHLMRKRQKEAEQAAVLREQVLANQNKKKKAMEDKKRQDARDEARLRREREELRRDHEKELAEKKHKEQREQLEQQIKEKQAMKARKEMEERLMQAKADEKLRRDRRELQEKYEKDKSPNPKAPASQNGNAEAQRRKQAEDIARRKEAQRIAELEAKLKAQQDAFQKEKEEMARQKNELESRALREREEVEARALRQRKEVEEQYRKQKATVEQQKAALAIQRSYRKNSPKKQSRARRDDRDGDRRRRSPRRSPRYDDEEETDESDVEYMRRRGGGRGRSHRRDGRDRRDYTPRTDGKIRELEESRQKAEEEAKRAREEMKQLRDEMEQFKTSVSNAAASPSAQAKHDKAMTTVGMATVRRSNRELKKAYNQLKERVEEQQKLILDIRKGQQSDGNILMAGGVQAGGGGTAAGSEEVRRLKEQMEQMRYEMQTRDMAAEFETQRRREMESQMDEELRMLLMDQAGVFSTGSDGSGEIGSGATGVTPRVGPGIQAISMHGGVAPMDTGRFLRGDISRNGGKSLNLDDIIAGQQVGKGGGGGGDPAKTGMLRPAGSTMRMAGESLSSKSKFIFPDGNTAPADSAPMRLQQSPINVGGGSVAVPPLNLEPINMDVRDSTNSLDVTSLYERNMAKISGLEQLSSNPDDAGSQDQLDQLLVDFLNQKMDPYEGRGGGGAGMSAPSGSDSLRAESRFVR